MPAERPARRAPWYAEGLRFACQENCGACCTNHDEHAYVYLEGDDAERIAAHLGLALDEFYERYTELDEGERILSMDRPECPFLEGTRCGIYSARPLQCRTFPFWKENLASRAAWERTRGFCPGIGEGDRVPLVQIRRHLADRGGE